MPTILQVSITIKLLNLNLPRAVANADLVRAGGCSSRHKQPDPYKTFLYVNFGRFHLHKRTCVNNSRRIKTLSAGNTKVELLVPF